MVRSRYAHGVLLVCSPVWFRYGALKQKCWRYSIITCSSVLCVSVLCVSYVFYQMDNSDDANALQFPKVCRNL